MEYPLIQKKILYKIIINHLINFMPEHELGGQPCESCGYSSGHSTDCPRKNQGEITPQEKTDLALKETAKVFKEALNPKSAIKKVKDFFGK